MPINKYFKGHGTEVMGAMKKTYPDTAKATKVFYATANARGVTPREPKVSIPKVKTPGERVGKLKRIKKVKRLDSIRTN